MRGMRIMSEERMCGKAEGGVRKRARGAMAHLLLLLIDDVAGVDARVADRRVDRGRHLGNALAVLWMKEGCVRVRSATNASPKESFNRPCRRRGRCRGRQKRSRGTKAAEITSAKRCGAQREGGGGRAYVAVEVEHERRVPVLVVLAKEFLESSGRLPSVVMRDFGGNVVSDVGLGLQRKGSGSARGRIRRGRKRRMRIAEKRGRRRE